MIINIVEPKKKRVAHLASLAKFLQQVANRFVQGGLMYGDPHKGRLFLSRLEKELARYKNTGNIEYLLNVATYCCLEGIAPEHSNSHHDATVSSVTRKEFGE